MVDITSKSDISVDATYPDVTVNTLSFGSCHKTRSVDPRRGIIWDSIASIQPDAFLWTGDVIYPPAKGLSDVDTLEAEYINMLTNATVGYSRFISPPRTDDGLPVRLSGGIHGTWDDHDYGGNDYGHEMPDRPERRDLFFNFLKASNQNIGNKRVDSHDADEESTYPNQRKGVYNSVSFGTSPQKVLILFMDTRWGRHPNCIPSLGRTKLPLGSVLASITRWITAGLHFEKIWPSRCNDQSMIHEEQWEWMQTQLEESDAQVHIVVSSIQITSTNPAVESWGHFPKERDRLLNLLNGVKGLVLLSGDVHHGELLDTSASFTRNEQNDSMSYHPEVNGRVIEVTSSGLTHSCDEPFYGPLCAPILNTFWKHRYHENTPSSSKRSNNPHLQNYYTGRNFGSINIDWGEGGNAIPHLGSKMKVNIHNEHGEIVLSTASQPLSSYGSTMSDQQLDAIPKCNDGHLLPIAGGVITLVSMIAVIYAFCKNFRMRTNIGCKEKLS